MVPLEVMSCTSLRAHAALDKLLESSEFGIPRGVVLSRLNIEVDGKVVYLPWYAIFCLDEVLLPEASLPKVALPKIYQRTCDCAKPSIRQCVAQRFSSLASAWCRFSPRGCFLPSRARTCRLRLS